MSDPFVSSFEQPFIEAFGRGCGQIPDDLKATVKAIVDRIHEDVIGQIEYYVADDLKTNMAEAVRSEAAAVAKSMLMNALAGDDKAIRNLFGFNDWYMRHAYSGDLPTQWALIDAIVAKRPDIILDERLRQRDQEIEGLRLANKNLSRQVEYMRRKLAGELEDDE